MIKVLTREKNDAKKEVMCQLFADSRDDVLPTLDPSIIPNGYKIAMGSMAVTSKGEYAYMKSDGSWSWAESGGGGGVDGREATQAEVDETIDNIVNDLHL